MRCEFCAEEIQDAAILCRFCGAQKKDGRWHPPGAQSVATARPRGGFTMKSAGVFFAISALFSLASVTSAVPLFGAMRGGAVAMAYNLFFAAIFVGIAIGLIGAMPWGFRVLLGGTVVFSLDKLLFVLDADARSAYLTASGVTKQVEVLFDTSVLDGVVLAAAIVSVACWWGFVLYAYLRRDYFQRPIEHDLS